MEAMRFLIVGVGNTLLGLSAIFLFLRLGLHDLVANALGYAIGLLFSFFANRTWTFRHSGALWPAFWRFISVFSVAYSINLATVIIMITRLGTGSFLAQVFGVVPYSVVFFLGSRLFAFKVDNTDFISYCPLDHICPSYQSIFMRIPSNITPYRLTDDKTNFHSTLVFYLFKQRSTQVLLLVSFIIGVVYAYILFGANYFSVNSPYWNFPRGLMGGISDLLLTYSAQHHYTSEPWQWPPFITYKMNWPEGISIANMDVIPLLSLTYKLFFSLTGYNVNFLAFWCAGTFCLNGVAMTLLLISLGHRNLLSTIIGTGFALLMPTFLWRYGHAALTAHFTILINLAIYFYYQKEKQPIVRVHVLFIINTIVSLLLNPYIFVMNTSIYFAFALQSIIDKKSSYAITVKSVLVFSSIVLALMYLEQLIGLKGVGKGWGFGYFSMNLLTPFWPQSSGLLSWTGIYWLNRGSIGGTYGQYEGFNYLGIGCLVLLVIAFYRRWRELPGLVKRNAALVLAMIVLLILALSNKVYLGQYLLLEVKIDENSLVYQMLNQFRSSGRFFWPVGYLLLAFAISTLLHMPKPQSAWLLCAMLTFQFIDTLPLQKNFTKE